MTDDEDNDRCGGGIDFCTEESIFLAKIAGVALIVFILEWFFSILNGKNFILSVFALICFSAVYSNIFIKKTISENKDGHQRLDIEL